MAMKKPNQRTCFYCKHFRNTPEYLEAEFKGFSSLGSGHASVRKDDGICLMHDLYLSADAWCDKFESGR